MPKNVYVIAGPNGAGKTTFAREFLPGYAHCPNFINADLIAQGVSPFAPERAAVRAGRLMLHQIRRFAQAGVDFGFETTLSGKTQVALWKRLQQQGYQIHLFFLWLESAALAEARVRTRVREGGHDVPPADLRRRYSRSIENFFRLYRATADFWMLIDNSQTPVEVAAKNEAFTLIMDEEKYASIAKGRR